MGGCQNYDPLLGYPKYRLLGLYWGSMGIMEKKWKLLYWGYIYPTSPFLGTLNIRRRIIIVIQTGTIILTTTHITASNMSEYQNGISILGTTPTISSHPRNQPFPAPKPNFPGFKNTKREAVERHACKSFLYIKRYPRSGARSRTGHVRWLKHVRQGLAPT